MGGEFIPHKLEKRGFSAGSDQVLGGFPTSACWRVFSGINRACLIHGEIQEQPGSSTGRGLYVSVKCMSLGREHVPSAGFIREMAASRYVIAFLWCFLPLSGPVLSLPDTVIIPETVVTAERGLDGDPVVASWLRDEIAARSPRAIDEEAVVSLRASYFGGGEPAGDGGDRDRADAGAARRDSPERSLWGLDFLGAIQS